MSGERFQSETGQSIDDNCCLLFGYTSPLFYTVNPRSGISLRQQEQLGAPSILKSFRDLPGCTRLSSSLSNLDSTGSHRRSQFPLLPDISHKGNMGKSLQGHSGKRFVRERYNPPFKVNAKIRHVYTQEVTTIEGQGQPNSVSQSQSVITCHRQTQTELHEFPESKQRPEAVSGNKEKESEDNTAPDGRTFGENEVKVNYQQEAVKTVDASTSPIPSPYFPTSATSGTESSSSNPFSGCSQMTVYPPLNYVRKLEDLEKITGHIVIQRFFTRTDDAFGTWLEKQLGMTSKSVSVDTSEFENAKTAELKDDEEEESPTLNTEETEAVVIENGEDVKERENNNAVVPEISHEGMVSAATKNDLGEDNTVQGSTDNAKDPHEDCTLGDNIKCECYLSEIAKANDNDIVKEIEEQIIVPEEAAQAEVAASPAAAAGEDEIETLVSSTVSKEEKKKGNEEDIDEVVRCTLEAYLMAPMTFEDVPDESESLQDAPGQEQDENNRSTSPLSIVKSEVDSGRAESIQSHEKVALEGLSEVEGNTSHDSVETVYENPIIPLKTKSELILSDKLDPDDESRLLQRSLSVDSCIGTESSGDAKNQTTNASQSSNDTIEGLDPVLAPKEMAELSLGSPASAPPTITSKLPPIKTVAKTVALSRRLSSAKSQRSITPCSPRDVRVDSRRNNKTDAEAEDADGESETESEITDHFLLPAKVKHTDGTDLELEEVDEDEGDDDDDRDAFDAMVANHLKYSRGLSTATSRRSKLNRGTQTTKSIEPSTTSGSMSPCSSSNSSFDVEIISKSKRITTSSSGAGGGAGGAANEQQDMITPSNMTLAWHEGGRRRSYLPSSSSSLNLLNMKFSLGKDFESEVSIRMPANKSSANVSSASMLLPGSGGTTATGGGRTLLSSSSRTHHHSQYQNRGLSPNQTSLSHYPNLVSQSPATSANLSNLPPVVVEKTELQSLWKDVKTKLDVQMDEMVAIIPEEDEKDGLHVRGNGILPVDPVTPTSATAFKLRRNEERIKRSLQRLKKILDD